MNEMYTAFRKNNLKCGFYYTVYEFEYPILVNNKIYIGNTGTQTSPDPSKQVNIPYDSKIYGRRISGKIAVSNYISGYFVPSLKEVIDNYDPDILWFDNEWTTAQLEIKPTLSPHIFMTIPLAGKKLSE